MNRILLLNYLVCCAKNLTIMICRLAHFLIAYRSVYWLADKFQPAACFYKESFIGTAMSTHLPLSVAAFSLQWPS